MKRDGFRGAVLLICNLAGNAIDFHVQVLGLSFHDAMRQITGLLAP